MEALAGPPQHLPVHQAAFIHAEGLQLASGGFATREKCFQPWQPVREECLHTLVPYLQAGVLVKTVLICESSLSCTT